MRRALYYVFARINVSVAEATENYIHSRSSKDSAECAYIIVRIAERNKVTYKYSYKSRDKNFNPNIALILLAFYMSTGREYARFY